LSETLSIESEPKRLSKKVLEKNYKNRNKAYKNDQQVRRVLSII
jgi:hypothetical protein